MAVYSMMFMGMGPLGSLLAGSAAHRIGAPIAVAAGGVISVLGAIVFGMRPLSSNIRHCPAMERLV